jgi:glycosyltransferase involved in cell wall biosynthesis/Flp pilus assembly protein TadD/SAM-dependent methyltransferase
MISVRKELYERMNNNEILQVECPICGGTFSRFLPFGTDRRENVLCPSCNSLERHRLLWFYLKERTNFFKEELRVLDIAPTKGLSEKIKSLRNINYLSIDIESPLAMRHMDITGLDLPDDSFDCVLCYHVLEHIPNDRKAISEILRVLKPGGWAILQVPLNKELKNTLEGTHIKDPQERKRLFGLEDHLRAYGLDYQQKLIEEGFKVNIDCYAQSISDEDTARFRIQKDEEIYFCTKPFIDNKGSALTENNFISAVIENDKSSKTGLAIIPPQVVAVSGTASKNIDLSVEKLNGRKISDNPKPNKVIIIEAGFPTVTETFILDQITGLIDRGLEIENWAIFNTGTNIIHHDIKKYNLLNKTKYITLPPEILKKDPRKWLQDFMSKNNIQDLNDVSAFHVHFGENFNVFEPLFRSSAKFVLVSFHGYDASKYFLQKGDDCYNYLFKRADRITTPSHFMKNELVKRGCDPAKITIHRYGIDLERFVCKNRVFNKDKITFLTVGRFVEKKGIEYSLKAFAKIHKSINAEYRIIGEGKLLGEYLQIVAQEGISDNVKFLGAKTKAEVIEEMCNADVFVLTSVVAEDGDSEGVPVSLTEAHAMGLPVISSYHAGIPELAIHEETGLLSNEKDIETIAQNMLKMASDISLREKLSKNAIERVKDEFDIARLNDTLFSVLSESVALVNKTDPGNISVSVIMAAHNAAPYLTEAIQSILKQTRQDFELIIIDDASTDETGEILEQFDDPRVRIIKNIENVGPAGSRNKALAVAMGNYIAIMDADDISLPHRFESQIRFLESNPDYALVGSFAYQIDELGQHQSVLKVQTDDNGIRRCLIRVNNFVHGSVMFRKRILLEMDGYDVRFKYAHDYDLFLRIIERHKVANLPEPLYCWRSSQTQISSEKKAEQDSFAEMARRKAKERMPNKGNSDSCTSSTLSATGYDTDKSPAYLKYYERYFSSIAGSPVRLLELGVLNGGSLYLWRDYFKKGIIVGLDVNEVNINDPSSRIRFYKGLQQDTSLLDRIRKECAPEGFDIVIDDASHIGDLSRLSFRHLFRNHLKPGGIYVIEDWGTGYWESFPDGKAYKQGENHLAGMVGFVKELIDECGMADITHPKRGNATQKESIFEKMEIRHGQVFIVKSLKQPLCSLDDADEYFQETSGPVSPTYLHQHAIQLFQQKRIYEAIRTMHRALDMEPKNAEFHNDIGALYYNIGNVDKASENFERATELDDTYLDAWKNLADIHIAAGQISEVERLYNEILVRHPDDLDTVLKMGELLISMGNKREAEQLLKRYLNTHTTCSAAQDMLSMIKATNPNDDIIKPQPQEQPNYGDIENRGIYLPQAAKTNNNRMDGNRNERAFDTRVVMNDSSSNKSAPYGKRMIIPDLVNIVIPTFNCGEWVCDAIESSLNQTYKKCEVIVIDDGSTDGTADILRSRYRDKIKYIFQQNMGLSAARNRGIIEANGGYIQFLDADDIISPDKIEIQVNALKDIPGYSVSYSDYISININDNSINGSRYLTPKTNTESFFHSLITDWETRFSIPVHCFLFKSGIFHDLQIGFDESLPNHEDWDCWVRVFACHPTVVYVDQKLAFYRIKPFTMCSDRALMRYGFMRSINKYMGHYQHDSEILELLKIKKAEMGKCYGDVSAADILSIEQKMAAKNNSDIETGTVTADSKNAPPHLIAFYLPQYHPIPENDQWWGKGFTEWTNVAKAKPLFHGHYQPHLPADLGFYDLRLSETREAQAELARRYGISGFCYYHYWFQGKRLLNRVFDEVMITGKPDFPFCLCWANENWTRVWDGGDKEILMEQKYSHEDDLAHIAWFIAAFKDPRYIKVHGSPLLLIYRSRNLPDPAQTAAIWREEVKKAGFPDLYLCAVESFIDEQKDPRQIGFSASVEFQPDWSNLGNESDEHPDVHVFEYRHIVENMMHKAQPAYTRLPCVTPSWDNSPRRGRNGYIFHNSQPVYYEKWLRHALSNAGKNSFDERIVFINAWNEWGEGNHLEPDQRHGHAYLHATKRALTVGTEKANLIEILTEKAATALDGGRLTEAEQFLVEALDYDPSAPQIQHKCAILLFQQGSLTEAIETMNRAVFMEPGNAEFNNDIGAMYHAAGDVAKAQRHFEKALEINPQDAASLKNLTELFIEKKQFEDARDICSKLITIYPDDQEAQHLWTSIQNLLKQNAGEGHADEIKKSPEANSFQDDSAIGIHPREYNTPAKKPHSSCMISIILSVKNNLKGTNLSIQSFFENIQDKNVELIIVDNGSHDGTRDYLRQLRHEKITVILSEKESTSVQGGILGAEKASGTFLMFLDDSVIIIKSWLKNIMKNLENTSDWDALVGKTISEDKLIIEAGSTTIGDAGLESRGAGIPFLDPAYNFTCRVESGSRFGMLIRRDVWDKVKALNTNLEDVGSALIDLGLEITSMGYRIVYQPQCILLANNMVTRQPVITNALSPDPETLASLRPTDLTLEVMPTVNKTEPKNILILGIYLANSLNTVTDIVSVFSGSKVHAVTQKWVALNGQPPDAKAAAVTVKNLNGRVPKFQIINELLHEDDLSHYDYIVLCDDDVVLPEYFVDSFIAIQSRLEFAIAQPARTLNSYIDHPIVAQHIGVHARETHFVEIGPVVSFHRSVYDFVFPFDLISPMGWGYENVWSHEAIRRILKMGIIDAVCVDHSLRKPVVNYEWNQADKERTAYLEKNVHLTLEECFRVVSAHIMPKESI